MNTNDLNATHLDQLCSHVINGGSPLDLCEKWDIAWDKLWLWVEGNKEYAHKFDKALHAQNEWAIARILKEIRLLSFTDHRQLYDKDKRMKHPTEWSKELGAVVESYEVVEYFEGVGREKEQVGWLKKVKLYDKQKALELYGKYLKMFGDRLEHTGSISLEELVDKSNTEYAARMPGIGVN
jgi:hypothetical protein